jgi:hypothetical protein
MDITHPANVGGQQAFPDRALAQFGAKRPVVLSLPFFVPAIFAIAQTDLILTGPQIGTDDCSDSSGTRRGTASRDQSRSKFYAVASATHY